MEPNDPSLPPSKRARGAAHADDIPPPYHDDENDDDENRHRNGEVSGTPGLGTTALTPYSNDKPDPTHLRTSSLATPTLLLTGHAGSVYALEYSPHGRALLSCSFDMKVLLWSHPDYTNYQLLQGHKNAVLDGHWITTSHRNSPSLGATSHGDHPHFPEVDANDLADDDDEEEGGLKIVTCGADKTVQIWDAHTGQRLRKYAQHDGVVNACAVMNSQTVVSVSDDRTGRIWDLRQKQPTATLSWEYALTAVTATRAGDGPPQIFTAGIDNLITAWDVRMEARKVYSVRGHTDTITCLAMHPAETHILSNSMDHTLRSWDIRPFVVGKNRQVKTFVGHRHNAEKGLLQCAWNATGTLVTAGSADKMVHIWDEYSTEELYLLPGHKGCVNAVAFHPQENVICSGASDHHIYVGELS